MRETYHQELDRLIDELAAATGLVDTAMRGATGALLSGDGSLADRVIGAEPVLDEALHALDDRAVNLLARQQPVARDLRTVVATLRMTADLERMGRLARHVAEVAARHPGEALPPRLHATVAEIGEVTRCLVEQAARAIATRDPKIAPVLREADDEMDRLQEVLYRDLLDDDGDGPMSTAIDVALIGRYYERFADHAVALASRIAYLAGTGDLDETPRAAHR